MAPPVKTALKAAIKLRLEELKDSCPPGLHPIKVLSQETGLKTWTLQYHLREPGKDRRRKYSKEQKTAIRGMSSEERTAYAVKRGVTPQAINQIARLAEAGRIGENLTQRLNRLGHFRFGNPDHVHAVGLNQNQIKEAKKILKDKFKLSLGQDNRLLHRKSGRECALTLVEQVALIKFTENFIRLRAKEIAERWRVK